MCKQIIDSITYDDHLTCWGASEPALTKDIQHAMSNRLNYASTVMDTKCIYVVELQSVLSLKLSVIFSLV